MTIRILKKTCEIVDRDTLTTKAICDMAGDSNDEKPTDTVLTGSSFVEADTGKGFLFNEDDESWHEI